MLRRLHLHDPRPCAFVEEARVVLVAYRDDLVALPGLEVEADRFQPARRARRVGAVVGPFKNKALTDFGLELSLKRECCDANPSLPSECVNWRPP